MSINMDGDRSVDYASFEHQHCKSTVKIDNVDSGQSENLQAVNEFEPLEDVGGLDTNEVAELVAMYRTVHVEPDDFTDSAPQANGNVEYRGVLGSDLNSTAETLEGGQPVGDSTVLQANNVPSGDQTLGFQSQTNPAIFDHFDVLGTVGFDTGGITDENGGGTGSINNAEERFFSFRDVFGAGPVVDSSDNISLASTLVSNNVQIGSLQGVYRLSLYWDIAEVDDAGRRFGIPEDD